MTSVSGLRKFQIVDLQFFTLCLISLAPKEIRQNGAGTQGRSTQGVFHRQLAKDVGGGVRQERLKRSGGTVGDGTGGGGWVAQEVHPTAVVANPSQNVIRDEFENVVENALEDARSAPSEVNLLHHAPAEQDEDENATPSDALGDDCARDGCI